MSTTIKQSSTFFTNFWQYPHLALPVQTSNGMGIDPFYLRDFPLWYPKLEVRTISYNLDTSVINFIVHILYQKMETGLHVDDVDVCVCVGVTFGHVELTVVNVDIAI